jgi:succinate dehydrogenase/fumarate reductase flavoprotein subunit
MMGSIHADIKAATPLKACSYRECACVSINGANRLFKLAHRAAGLRRRAFERDGVPAIGCACGPTTQRLPRWRAPSRAHPRADARTSASDGRQAAQSIGVMGNTRASTAAARILQACAKLAELRQRYGRIELRPD